MTDLFNKVLQGLNLQDVNYGASDEEIWYSNGKEIEVISPINDRVIAKVKCIKCLLGLGRG